MFSASGLKILILSLYNSYKEKQQIITSEKLEPSRFCHSFLNNYLFSQMIIRKYR